MTPTPSGPLVAPPRLRPVHLSFTALLAAIALATAPAMAQQAPAPTVTPRTRTATRADLERLATSYDQLAASTAYSERTRVKARTEAQEVRRRLRDGDFRVGDQIIVEVTGAVPVHDTLTVLEGPRIQIAGIRQIELAGVLRSELAAKATVEVTEIVRAATVSVRPLARIAVFGAVTNPGYYAVPSETTLDQLITLAGGPSENARPEGMRLLRGETVLLKGDEVMAAIAAGRTLDALDTYEGDVLEVERRDAGWQTANTMQLLTMVIGPLITFLLLR